MSHTLSQTGHLTPIKTQSIPSTKTLFSKPLLPARAPNHWSPPVPGGLRKGLVLRGSFSPAPAPAPEFDGDTALGGLERCFRALPPSDLLPASSLSSVMYGAAMKGQHGAFGAATRERSNLDLSQKQTKSSSPEAEIGGSGGDIGKEIYNGGGNGGDDDNYFQNFDDGDEKDDGGLFRRRVVLQELFDWKFVDPVLREWQKTMMDLPAGLRQACEMGLVSSAQMVKYLSIHARPTTARLISRTLPQGMSREFNGRQVTYDIIKNEDGSNYIKMLL